MRNPVPVGQLARLGRQVAARVRNQVTAGSFADRAGHNGMLPNDAVALVRSEDGRAVSVAPGENTPGGWRLDALSADAAVFSRGAERARVSLPEE